MRYVCLGAGLGEPGDGRRCRRQDQRGVSLHLLNRREPIPELRDDAEVAAATTDRPEQIRLVHMINDVHSTVGGDDLGGEDVVDGHPEQPAQEPDFHHRA